MHRVLIVAAAFVVALIAPSSASQTATTPQQPSKQMQTQPPAKHGQMTMDCQQMMQAHQKMVQDLQAMDARLDTLVKDMNSAAGQAKVDATAAVVNEMITQRKKMTQEMRTMQSQSMRHMAEHMQAGGGASMMNCPMMNEGK